MLSTVLLSAALPAFASGEAEAEPATVAEQVDLASVGKVPVVVVEQVAGDPYAHPWTTRFLVPTMMVLAGVMVLGTAVQYYRVVIRGRYKVVG